MIHTQAVSLRPRKEQLVRETKNPSHCYQIMGITYSGNICQNIYVIKKSHDALKVHPRPEKVLKL